MAKEFSQVRWDAQLDDDCRQIVRLAVREDLDRQCDWTTVSLASSEHRGSAVVVARQAGAIAGLKAAEVALDEMDAQVTWESAVHDGDDVQPGDRVARMSGSMRDLLTAERLVLNLIGRLSGIASTTQQYVQAVSGSKAGIYDTRKTTPGWRRLEKYAVGCGGGRNHRTGLFDAVLIKDNHLALAGLSPSQAVARARDFVRGAVKDSSIVDAMILEIEVDTLEQLDDVLPAGPDIVLLDNMSLDELRSAVSRRDATAPAVQLEASGGVTLATVAGIAATGVDRISVGALTHSAQNLDVGLDWSETS